nr:hypothetical protein [Micromonospora sp. DSM 115978]
MSIRRGLAGVGLCAVTAMVGACEGNSSPDATPTLPPIATPVTPGPTATSTPSGGAAAPTDLPPVLAGDRQVTIVRTEAFESGLSLADGGRLGEADDDSGRQLFVPTPTGDQTFLVMSYFGAGGGPGEGEPICWQVRNPGNAQPLHVEGAECDEKEPRQRFEIVAAEGGAEDTYLISNGGAFLRSSARSGLILEELGDAPPADTFRFNDNGPAPDRN